MLQQYECTNPKCDHVTTVRHWRATLVDPADSTWGDGCAKCCAELEDEALDDWPPEPDYEPDDFDEPIWVTALDHGAGGGDPDDV